MEKSHYSCVLFDLMLKIYLDVCLGRKWRRGFGENVRRQNGHFKGRYAPLKMAQGVHSLKDNTRTIYLENI